MKLKIFYMVCSYLISLFHANEGARILGIFIASFKSHFSYTNAVMKSLSEAGHEVTIITPFSELASRQNYTEVISFPLIKELCSGQMKYDAFAIQNIFKLLNLMLEYGQWSCTYVLYLPEIQKILKSDEEKLYDIVILEILPLYQCFLPVAEKMKVPVIGLTTFRTSAMSDTIIYNPNNPAYIGNEMVTRKWKLTSIVGRIINAWNSVVLAWYMNYVIPKEIETFHQNHVDQLDNLQKYKNMNPDLIFYNNYATFFPRPMNPNAIEVGGIHIENARSLPKNIQKFIDEADRGVILFTLGSIARAATLSFEIRNAFREAFAEIPQRVIWKFEEEIASLSNNVMLLDWLPQRDILEHKNVIAFITHCGLSGTIEAIHTATMVVACPLWGDQLDNAESLVDQEVAVHLDIDDITKENVLNALNKIINESKYSENMQKLSKEFKDRLVTPQQQVVYWTEQVIRNNGAPNLKNVASRLNWFQYFLLDVASVVLIILVSVIYLVYRICRFFHFLFTRKSG